MRKRSERKTSAKAAADATEALIESAQPKTVTTRPRMPSNLTDLVEKVFSLEDPVGLYDELEEALDKRSVALTPGVLRDLLADSPRLYREAHRLYITARTDFERYEVEFEAFHAAMRDEARNELEREKSLGVRSKAPTIKDIEDRMHTMYPEAVAEMRERNIMARKTVEDLNHMVDVFKARGFALKALVGGKEEL